MLKSEHKEAISLSGNKLKITLPPDLAALPLNVRTQILGNLRAALDLPETKPVTTRGAGDEHDIWTRNPDELLADWEDTVYEQLVLVSAERIAAVMQALELPLDAVDFEKAFTLEFHVFEDQLQKAKNGKPKKRMKQLLEDLVNITREKREAFMKYISDGTPWNRQQRRALDKLMKQVRKVDWTEAETQALATRAALIGKLRDHDERELMETTGAVIDRWPETIKEAAEQPIVMYGKAEEKRRFVMPPLTPEEVRAVEHAAQSAADKISEVTDRHEAAIRNLVVTAKKQRWTAAQLAQALYDAFGDQNRDWRRVAITELAMAANDAFLSGMEEGATVIGMSAANACKHCAEHITGKTYIVTHDPAKMNEAHGYTHVWPGKTNYGRRAAGYWPCIPVHPSCRCRWMRMSNFYKVEDGQQVRKTTAELIQEERAKRGLAPDPNL